MNLDNLIRQFDKVNLDLVPARQPIARTGNNDVFQMDIRGRARNEVFLVWPGAEENLAVVQASDKKLEQVVLFVKEEAREFWEQAPRSNNDLTSEAAFRAQNPRIDARTRVAKNDGVWWVSRKTSAEQRHFLVGRDERQLFMCRLPRAATSVMEAHQALKNPRLDELERRGDGSKTVRQGEWFFVAISEAEYWEIENLAKTKTDLVYKKVGINRFIPRPGKQHVADEILITTPIGATEMRVYVRGGVRHPDHKTVNFFKWHRVLRNNEFQAFTGSGVSLFGGTWID